MSIKAVAHFGLVASFRASSQYASRGIYPLSAHQDNIWMPMCGAYFPFWALPILEGCNIFANVSVRFTEGTGF
jgi:hypothetical protein